MLVTKLNNLKSLNELISIRRNCGDEDHTGVIEFANDEIIIMCRYTDDGEYDGYSMFYTEQAYEVLWGNREHKAISNLIKKYGNKVPFKAKGNTFEEVFSSIQDTYSNICIYTSDESSFDIGVIEESSEDWLEVKNYGPKKTLSNLNKLIKVDDIGRIDVDSPYQNRIVELHQDNI